MCFQNGWRRRMCKLDRKCNYTKVMSHSNHSQKLLKLVLHLFAQKNSLWREKDNWEFIITADCKKYICCKPQLSCICNTRWWLLSVAKTGSIQLLSDAKWRFSWRLFFFFFFFEFCLCKFWKTTPFSWMLLFQICLRKNSGKLSIRHEWVVFNSWVNFCYKSSITIQQSEILASEWKHFIPVVFTHWRCK